MTRGAALELAELTKSYGNTRVVDSVSLSLRAGEFVSLLGPSGSGKTTTLKMIAGFVRPDGGRVVLDGRDLVGVPVHRRDIGVVFQQYALFPHMTALDNVAFPLRMRGQSASRARRTAAEALDSVRLARVAGHRPRELSGGQQQRVALARALVFHPSLLLMDEPLGALDKALREEMQVEILRIAREVGVTVVYVTHDQSEALAMSDRIAVYSDGRIEQVGDGEELYCRPRTRFVAEFIGDSTVFEGTLAVGPDGAEVRSAAGALAIDAAWLTDVEASAGDSVALVVRPEAISLLPQGQPPDGDGKRNTLPGSIEHVRYLGPVRLYHVGLAGHASVKVARPASEHAPWCQPGASIELSWRVRDAWIVPQEPGEARAAPHAELTPA